MVEPDQISEYGKAEADKDDAEALKAVPKGFPSTGGTKVVLRRRKVKPAFKPECQGKEPNMRYKQPELQRDMCCTQPPVQPETKK